MRKGRARLVALDGDVAARRMRLHVRALAEENHQLRAVERGEQRDALQDFRDRARVLAEADASADDRVRVVVSGLFALLAEDPPLRAAHDVAVDLRERRVVVVVAVVVAAAAAQATARRDLALLRDDERR